MKIKKEPIIWEEGKGSLVDFYQIANGLELSYIIYVIDALGELDSVWATAEEDVLECFSSFSDKCFYGRIRKVFDVIEYGFFDEFKISKQKELSFHKRSFKYDSQEVAFEALILSVENDFYWDSYNEIDFWMNEFIRDHKNDLDWVNTVINFIGHDYYLIKEWFKTQIKKKDHWSIPSFDLIKMFANSFDKQSI